MDEIKDKNESFYSDYEKNETKKRDSKPLIAGILLIIAGIMAILTWMAVLSIDYSLIDLSMLETQNVTISSEQFQSIIGICASIGIILSIFPLIGGILSIQKKLWGGALAGSIIGLFTIGPVFLSSFLSLISLILLFISKNEFQNKNEIIEEY